MAAIVLGTESGLTNAQIALCHRICHIPANPQYSSLNVAQALQLAAWELRYALLIDQGAALLPVSTAQEPSRGAECATASATSPANPQYSSLNVAQALQLAAWELRYALLIDQGAALLPVPGRGLLPVSTAQEPSRGAERPPAKRCRPSWLVGIGAGRVRFLDPSTPKLMPRMHLFRAGLTRDEVDMMRGVCTAMLTDYRQREK